MKKLYTLLSLFMIFGCSSSESINQDLLNKKDGVFYTKDTNEPYSGKVFSLYDDGKKKDEGTIKDGKMISYKEFEWYDNGQKMVEETYKGKNWYGLPIKDGLSTRWYKNGQKEGEGTFKDGKLEGLVTGWYENGQKKEEVTFKDGEMISGKKWNEDGSVKE